MATDTAASAGKGGTGRNVLLVGVASLVSAASTYVINVLAARTLPVAENTQLLTHLAILFFFYGIVGAVATEFTRSVAQATQTGVANGPRALPVTLGLAGIVGAAFVVSSVWWSQSPGTSVSVPLVALMAAGVVGYTVHVGLCGVLAGVGRWPNMSLLVGAEGLGRVVFAVLAFTVGASAGGYLGAVVAAAFVWVGFMFSSTTIRSATRSRLDSPLRVQAPRFGAAFVAQSSSVALTVSFPVLLAWTTPTSEYLTSAPLLLAISLTRAPLMIPLTAYQSMILEYFVREQRRAGRGLAILAAGVLGVGLLGAGLAWLIGPALLTWLLSPAYHVDGAMLAILTISGAGLALVTITGAVTQALARHVWFAAGWVSALLVSLGLLLVPGPIYTRTSWALAAGPIVGCLVHGIAIVRASRRGQALGQ